MTPKLQVRNLSYSYHSHSGETKALSHISFDVADGEFLAVVGPAAENPPCCLFYAGF